MLCLEHHDGCDPDERKLVVGAFCDHRLNFEPIVVVGRKDDALFTNQYEAVRSHSVVRNGNVVHFKLDLFREDFGLSNFSR